MAFPFTKWNTINTDHVPSELHLGQRLVIYFGEKFSIYFTGAMGSGGSKKSNLDVGYNPDRRPSQHELTNPPTESRGIPVHKPINHKSLLQTRNHSEFISMSILTERIYIFWDTVLMLIIIKTF